MYIKHWQHKQSTVRNTSLAVEFRVQTIAQYRDADVALLEVLSVLAWAFFLARGSNDISFSARLQINDITCLCIFGE